MLHEIPTYGFSRRRNGVLLATCRKLRFHAHRAGCSAQQGCKSAQERARSAKCSVLLLKHLWEEKQEGRAIEEHGTAVGGNEAEAVYKKL